MLKLNVGVSKKIGQPDYGSLGASCNIEVELDTSLLQTDLDGFHEKVARAYTACRQAVTDELARRAAGEANGTSQARQTAEATGARTGSNGNGSGHSHQKNGGTAQRASARQADYIQQLAGQIRGLGVRRLEQLAQKMFSKPVAELSSLDASGLIDTLRAIKDGKININDALNGAAA